MLMPYFHFSGNCEEAFRFYASVFGGKIVHLSRFTAETGSRALVGKIMHGIVSLGEGRGVISGSDQDGPMEPGGRVELLFHCATPQEGRFVLEKLAQEGRIGSGFSPHPPPDDAGMGALVTDKYGYTWILSAPNDRRHE